MSDCRFWIAIVATTLFLGGSFFWITLTLNNSSKWFLADAVSEDISCPAMPGDKPVMVASISRLIALFGLTGILGIFLGIGYYVIWALFAARSLDSLEHVQSFFLAVSTIFAPYIANQAKKAFMALAPSKAPPALPAAATTDSLPQASRTMPPESERKS